jgi:hypothetical protein
LLPGILRILVVFHEAELLGAGQSVLNAVAPLGEFGWSLSGWIPGQGPLTPIAGERLAWVGSYPRPIAFSTRGWRMEPGVRTRLRRTPGYLRAVRSTLVRIRPHVVHANTLLSLPEAWLAKRLGIPVVMQVHEVPPDTLKRRGVLMIAARTSDILVGVSEAVSAMLRRHAGQTPVLTVHNGIGSELTSGPEAATADAFTVGTIGTVSRLKGTDVFLRAASLALRSRPELRFEHVGQPDLHRDEGLDAELAGLLASEPLRSSLTMLGRRPAAELLPSWDVFVLPSRMEAFPLATLEAMAAGVPVIAARVGGVPEQIEHLRTGVLVAPDDPVGLAEWILRLHDDRRLRERLAAEAARRVRSQFTAERQAEGLHRAYLLALNRRFGPPSVRAAAREAT